MHFVTVSLAVGEATARCQQRAIGVLFTRRDMNMQVRELLIESDMSTDKLRGCLQTAVMLGDARRCGKLLEHSLQEEDKRGLLKQLLHLSMEDITACNCKISQGSPVYTREWWDIGALQGTPADMQT